jgi:hypothetical protein
MQAICLRFSLQAAQYLVSIPAIAQSYRSRFSNLPVLDAVMNVPSVRPDATKQATSGAIGASRSADIPVGRLGAFPGSLRG